MLLVLSAHQSQLSSYLNQYLVFVYKCATDAGVGVFARTFLPTRTWLGEFEGKLTLGFNATGGDYAWRVDCGYQTAYYIGG